MAITYIHEPWPTEFRTRTDISIAWDALARRSNDLWIAWAGYTDLLLNTIYSTGEFVFRDESKTTYEDDGTPGTPSLATLDNDLVLAWAGTDSEHKINAAYIGRSGEMIDKVTPNLGSFSGALSGVSAAGYQDQFHIGWAASGSAHNITTMSGPWDDSPRLLSNEMRSIHPPALQPPLIAWVDSSSDLIYIGRV